MNAKEKIDYLIEKFRRDPLFNRIQRDNLESTLLSEDDEFFTRIDFETTYSSKKAAEILEISSPQTLINLLTRNGFNEYLKVSRLNERFYRYDWQSIFKYKMILLLISKNYQPLEIGDIIGTTPNVESVSSYSTQGHAKTINAVPELMETKIQEKIKQTVEILLEKKFSNSLELMTKVDERRSKITDAKNHLTDIQNQLSTNAHHLHLWGEKMLRITERLDDIRRFREVTVLSNSEVSSSNSFITKWFAKPQINEAARIKKNEHIKEIEAVEITLKEEKKYLDLAKDSLIKEQKSLENKLELARKELQFRESGKLLLNNEENEQYEQIDDE